jgi:AraC family transcriptional regulator of adaptative response / DNA-3-methyladenine glycosylase II
LDARDPPLFSAQLMAIPGIGPRTAEYMRMRVLHWPDAFPTGDLGMQQAAMPGQRQTERQLIAHSAAWQPWRSYATILLWKSLENQGG